MRKIRHWKCQRKVEWLPEEAKEEARCSGKILLYFSIWYLKVRDCQEVGFHSCYNFKRIFRIVIYLERKLLLTRGMLKQMEKKANLTIKKWDKMWHVHIFDLLPILRIMYHWIYCMIFFFFCFKDFFIDLREHYHFNEH